jgi:MFS family permease
MNSAFASITPRANEIARRYRFFPGWTMLGMSAAAQFMSAPGQSYSVAAFKGPMQAGLGISETNYSLAYGFATVISGISLPYVGRLIDRLGARRLLPIIALLLGGACVCMSLTSGLGSLYISFSLVRSLGQGALTLVSIWLVGEWFERRRGFATALAGLGGSVSVMLFPLMNWWLIGQFGWQTGWLVLAALVWGVLLVPSLFLIRDRPEELGLLPDGDNPASKPEPASADLPTHHQVSAEPASGPSGWRVADVLRDPTFWKLLAVPATSGMVGTGLIFHAVSLLGSRGVPAGWALALISFQAVVATIVALVAGQLTDHYPNRYLLAAAMLLLASGVAIILVMPWTALAFVYAIMLGLHGSILRSAGMVVWMTYYGRAHQGEIRGVAMAVMILGAAVGPLPLALSMDRFDSYTPALILFLIAPICASALVLTAGPPQLESDHEAPGGSLHR